jgi:PAS domain S-box-containing protein
MNIARVLIAEDEAVIALDIKNRIISFGYQVVGIAATAEECIKLASDTKPDLVLMDIILRGNTTGITAAEILKRDYDLRVIFLTAHTDDATIAKAKLTEPLGFIIKPFEAKEIKTTLEIALYKAKMERQLAESELRYRTLVLTATDGVLTLDENGIVTSVNNKAIELFGYYEAEIVGSSIKKILPDVFVNHLKEGIKKFLEVGKVVTTNTMELLARKKEGTDFPVELSFSQWETKSKSQFTLIIRDITLRRESESVIRKYQAELERRVEERTVELTQLINQLPIGINLYNMDGNVIYKNRACSKIWIKTVDELESENYSVFNDPILIRYGYLEKLKEVFEKGGSFSTKPLYFDKEELSFEGKDEGHLFILHFYAVINDTGNVFRIVNLVEDITDHAIAEEANLALREQKITSSLIFEKLEIERNRISRELHDGLGQILSAIKINLEVFEKGNRDDLHPLITAKTLIGDANSEIKNIIFSLHPSFLDKYGLVTALKSLCQSMNESTGILFNLINHGLLRRLNPKHELTVFRVVQEAINNIVKHSKSKTADVIIYLNSDILSIIINDKGIGFNVSQVGDPKRPKSFGLVSMRERVEILDGSFNIESEPGKGTEISIIIPVSASDE